MRAIISAAVLLFLPPAGSRADDPPPAFVLTTPPRLAPERFLLVPWRAPDGSFVEGYWYASPQVLRIDARIKYLETKAAKECVDQQIEAAKTVGPWIKIVAGVVTGATIGYCAGAPGHCKLYK